MNNTIAVCYVLSFSVYKQFPVNTKLNQSYHKFQLFEPSDKNIINHYLYIYVCMYVPNMYKQSSNIPPISTLYLSNWEPTWQT